MVSNSELFQSTSFADGRADIAPQEWRHAGSEVKHTSSTEKLVTQGQTAGRG